MENSPLFFTGICTKKEKFQGNAIQKDFDFLGKHYVKFGKSLNKKSGKFFIGVEVSGFLSKCIFTSNPKNKNEEQMNDYFINKYLIPCDNYQDIAHHFGIIILDQKKNF